MKITLWTPSADKSVSWRCVNSWWNLETPDNIKLRLYPGMQIANNVKYSWNRAILDFLDNGDDWLLSWHSDVIGVPQTLMRLLSWDKPLVSALIFMRTSPAMPHTWTDYPDSPGAYAPRIKAARKWFYDHPDCIKEFGPYVMEERPDDALFPISFTSTSCVLIHRIVLEGMRELIGDMWFKWDDDYAGGGEDRYFFENAKRAGFQAYQDYSCVVGHLVGDIPTSAADFFAWDYVSTVLNTGEHEIIK